jgi:hypothetical protein
VDVDLMLAQITPEQFDEWVAFGCFLEPFGQEIDWLKTGTIAAMIFAANGGKGSGCNPASYVPKFNESKKDSIDTFRRQMEARYS